MNPFEDECDNDPNDERMDRALADPGASLGDVKELHPWGDRPKTEQEVLEAIFYPNGVPKPEMEPVSDEIINARLAGSFVTPIKYSVTGDNNNANDASWVAFKASITVPKHAS
ncbi:hypothetical protein PMIN02_008047 [Paraphaeosphaeria minitans]